MVESAQFYAPIVNFAVVLLVLFYFGRKPFAEAVASRSADLAKAIRGAEAEAKEAQALLSTWEAKAKGSQAEAKQNFEDAQKRSSALSATTVVNARKQAERIVQEAKLIGQTEANKGRATLQQEVVRKSIAMATDFLGAHVGDKDRHQLVTEYVELVGNGSAR